MKTNTTKKARVGRPRKGEPRVNPYIELQEVDIILNQISMAIESATVTRDGVYKTSDLILEQQAEPGSAEALMLYQNKQEMYFTRIHADGVLDSLKYMQQRFMNMRKLFTMEADLRKEAEKMILKNAKK